MEKTLQDIRKEKFDTIKAFAEAANVSQYKAEKFLRGDGVGNHMSMIDIDHLGKTLDLTFDETLDAMKWSYIQTHHLEEEGAPDQTCPSCGMVSKPQVRQCPQCGYQLH